MKNSISLCRKTPLLDKLDVKSPILNTDFESKMILGEIDHENYLKHVSAVVKDHHKTISLKSAYQIS